MFKFTLLINELAKANSLNLTPIKTTSTSGRLFLKARGPISITLSKFISVILPILVFSHSKQLSPIILLSPINSTLVKLLAFLKTVLFKLTVLLNTTFFNLLQNTNAEVSIVVTFLKLTSSIPVLLKARLPI